MTAMAAAMTVLLPTVGSAAGARAAGMGGHPVASAGAMSSDSAGSAAVHPSELAAADLATPPPGPGFDRAPAPPASTLPGDGAGAPPQPAPDGTGSEATTTAATVPEGSGSLARPRIAAAVAMGASVDASSSPIGKAFVAPAFAGELGFGDGPLGFDVRLLSSQASGRTSDAPPDRLSVDLMMAIRPGARGRDDARWGTRVRRALTIGVGLGGERISAGPVHAYRAGLVVGLRADFPLTGVTGEPGELRLRLAFRRLLAGQTNVGTVKPGDSTEVLTGLVVVF